MQLALPHLTAPGLCPVNGIRDLIHWRTGQNWSNQFLWGLGLGGGFAYLRINVADPPRQVYWGNAGPRQHKYLAELLSADYTEIENRSFKFSWRKAQQAVDKGTPPVIGPLDMYYLHFYKGIYQERHIPIHYLLLVGYDDKNAYVLDTGQEDVQTVSLEELEPGWDVNVPGLGKRNRLVIIDIPKAIRPIAELIKQSIADECRTMLNPPVSMLGIPAMKKLAREIAGWPEELGEKTAAKCLLQVREYLNSPPDLAGNHLTAGRDLYITFLEETGAMTGWDFSEATSRLRSAITIIPQLAAAIQQGELNEAATYFGRIAHEEAEAFAELNRVVGA